MGAVKLTGGSPARPRGLGDHGRGSPGPEQRSDKRPLLSDLREPGGSRPTPDQVVMLYRDEVYTGERCDEPGVAEAIVRKNRHGPLGTSKLAFVERWPAFRSLSRDGSGDDRPASPELFEEDDRS